MYAHLETATDVQNRTGYLAASATVRRAEGRLEEALSVGAEAAERSGAAFGVGSQSVKQGLVEAVEASLALGGRERAEELLATIDALPPGLRPPYLDAQRSRFRARLDGDEESFKAAANRFRELEIPFWLAVTLLEHGEWLTGEDRLAEAEPLLAEAFQIVGQLGATPWIERLERAWAGREVLA